VTCHFGEMRKPDNVRTWDQPAPFDSGFGEYANVCCRIAKRKVASMALTNHPDPSQPFSRLLIS